ncbi:hypothetical protein THAOC_05292 [Thalassiosira oceanica]|uniref:DUF1995 domain-containing protein n=1 Tax=Thalassiosira oceanica TaxID=159749 RepID=K0THH5_THAOC|nr:hypothetical protein THAOC_05292 [Thalassiosira oceanica]|eukprot:EJK73106.1 hypothetical protein THAOC_05292 [Thalassiosira oceanica]
MPVGNNERHSAVSAVSRKSRFSILCGGVNAQLSKSMSAANSTRVSLPRIMTFVDVPRSSAPRSYFSTLHVLTKQRRYNTGGIGMSASRRCGAIILEPHSSWRSPCSRPFGRQTVADTHRGVLDNQRPRSRVKNGEQQRPSFPCGAWHLCVNNIVGGHRGFASRPSVQSQSRVGSAAIAPTTISRLAMRSLSLLLVLLHVAITRAFIPLIDGGKNFPQLYDGYFNEQICKQASTAVSRAISAGKRNIQVEFPPVPNVEEVKFGTPLNLVSIFDYACLQALCTDMHNRKPSEVWQDDGGKRPEDKGGLQTWCVKSGYSFGDTYEKLKREVPVQVLMFPETWWLIPMSIGVKGSQALYGGLLLGASQLAFCESISCSQLGGLRADFIPFTRE